MPPRLFPACYLAANCFVEAWLPKLQLCISGLTGCPLVQRLCGLKLSIAASIAVASAGAVTGTIAMTTSSTTTTTTTTTTATTAAAAAAAAAAATANMAAAVTITFPVTTIALIVTRLIAISYNFLPLPKLVQEGRP